MEAVRRGMLAGTLAGIAALVLVLGADAADARAGNSVVGSAVRTTSSHTVSLYVKNDPWRSYLAGERACPGGERIDAPLAHQQRTLACLVNWARRKMGLTSLDVTSTLSRSSALKAGDIARCEKFAHDPCGGSWASRIRAAGYVGSVAENLYLATGAWGAPRVAVDRWLNSATHRANLFDPRWRLQGLAAAQLGTFEGHPAAVVWVSQFGS